MKNFQTYIKTLFLIASSVFFITGCVHDDIYNVPDLSNYNCQDLVATKTLTEVKTAYANITTEITTDDVIVGYVSSTDETGNIYKTIFLQDLPENPTQGLVVSVDAVSTYTNFPKGSKVYIKLKGLAFSKYGGVLQLGAPNAARIPEKNIPKHLFRSCSAPVNIVPKVMTLSQFTTANNTVIEPLIGCLVQINNAEFSKTSLCTNYAPEGTSIDRQIVDSTMPTASSSRVVRNSGFASFAKDIMPSGNGTFIGVLSKFNSTFQFYINNTSDLIMNNARLDGIVSPCSLNPAITYTYKTVKEVKQLYPGSMSEITGDFLMKGRVTSSDKTGNHFKYVYLQDETGGIRLKINKTALYSDVRFVQGSEVIVSLKNLRINNVSGEIQLGALFNNAFGNIDEGDIYKYVYKTNAPNALVEPALKTITSLTTDDIGKWIRINDVQFSENDLGIPYSGERTLVDCSNNSLKLKTSNFATFSGTAVTTGKGNVYGILSITNGVYQLWINDFLGANLTETRCDGSAPPIFKNLFYEDFTSGLTTNWATANVIGTQVWGTSNTGTGSNFYAVMNGFSGGAKQNEDWLISNPINLSDYIAYSLSFDSDVRFTGNDIEVFITENYTGTPSTTTWTKLNPTLDTVSGSFGFVNSGVIDLTSFANKTIRVAFKYTSTTTAAATWEIDNVTVRGRK